MYSQKDTTKLITLYAFRENLRWQHKITTLKDVDGNIKAVFPSYVRQPRKGQKYITINCFKYALNWDNVYNKNN